MPSVYIFVLFQLKNNIIRYDLLLQNKLKTYIKTKYKFISFIIYLYL